MIVYNIKSSNFSLTIIINEFTLKYLFYILINYLLIINRVFNEYNS